MRGAVHRRGKSWRAVIDLPHGEEAGRKQRTKTFRTRREAEDWVAEISVAAGSGYADPGRITVGQFLDRWLGAVGPTMKPNTRRYCFTASRRWQAALGQVRIEGLGALQIQEAVNRMAAGGLAPITVRRSLTMLRTAFRQGVTWGVVPRDVTVGVRGPRGSREMRCWNETQAGAFAAGIRGKTRYEALFRLALASGMRLGELLGLRWEDIDWDGGAVGVRRSLSWPRNGQPELLEPKTTSSRRVIALDEVTMGALRQHRARQAEDRLAAGGAWQDTGVVFCTQGGAFVDQRRIQRLLPSLARGSGVPRIRFHDLRHTHATILLRQGRSIKEVAERLGHSSVSITLQTYVHVLPDQRTGSAQVMGKVLGGATL